MKQEMTITLSAQVAVSNSETGVSYVQVMPDEPSAGLVKPFHGMGYGQMLTNGAFDFVRRPRKRRKPELKLPHSSVSYGEDGYDRYTLTLPSEQREMFASILMTEATVAAQFVGNEEWEASVTINLQKHSDRA